MNKVPDMGAKAEFGWCVAVVLMPQGKDRFYGPFECESDARAWIKVQTLTLNASVGIMPLRKTDIVRTHDDFYNPLLDWDASDFWSVKVMEVGNDGSSAS